MSKRIISVFTVLFLILCMCSCGSGDKDKSLQKVLDKKRIVIGIDPAGGVMSSETGDGKFEGFSVECAKLCAKRLGLSAEFKAVSPEDLGQALDKGQIDCYWDFSSPDRQLKADYLFIPSGTVHHQVVIVNAADTKIKNIGSLKGQVVGVTENSFSQKALENAGVLYADLGEVKTFTTVESTLQALGSGQIAAAVADDNEVRRYITLRGDKTIKSVPGYISTDNYYVGFLRSSVSLEEKINSIIEGMLDDGTIKDLSMKWFSASAVAEKQNKS